MDRNTEICEKGLIEESFAVVVFFSSLRYGGEAQMKKEKGVLVLFPCLPKNESSNHYTNHAHYAFNVIRRKYFARYACGHIWVIGHQYGIGKQ
jgi:hypothetical protein